ncbi:MAG: hypothetical protein KatS3mg118_3571 [Paracoccaceae bacterium]|nr:MAG: hypothetical protein KatS3mg118_3571 [Paracoccaceae bacterium]
MAEREADRSADGVAGFEEGGRPDAAGQAGTGHAVIRDILARLPDAPGVYRMLDARGDACSTSARRAALRKRVAAYARPSGHSMRIARMIAATAAMDGRADRHRDRGAAAGSRT